MVIKCEYTFPLLMKQKEHVQSNVGTAGECGAYKP